MDIKLNCALGVVLCSLLIATVARPQEPPKQDNTSSVTIVTAGNVSITKENDGKTAVIINFVSGKAKTNDTRITISGPYSLNVNGGVQEVQGAQGVELHVLSHEELRFAAPEISAWEQSHKYSEYTACSKIPKFSGCGNPICDQFGHPGDQCRYNSVSGCACTSPTGGPCAEAATAPQDKRSNQN
ncbi:MAG TPA: hypothetical protein VIH78_08250 [Terriglobales bacterium]|jgi:hypothetical protein